MKLRIIHLDPVSPVRSQAIYHGLADNITQQDEPILILVRPNAPYFSIGLHQNMYQALNIAWCRQQGFPVIRRHVGGGAVLLDQDQLFFQWVIPYPSAPKRPARLYQQLLQPLVSCYHSLGCSQASLRDNDVQIKGKKICGTGAARITDASVLVGNFLVDFDFRRMAQALNAPSQAFRAKYLELMQQYMTTMKQELPTVPSDQQLARCLAQAIARQGIFQPYTDQLTVDEWQAIEAAEHWLQDPEWTDQPGKALIPHGIKIAAQTYLLEKPLDDMANGSLRVLIEAEHIQQLWLDTDKTLTETDLALLRDVNQRKPHINALLSDTRLPESWQRTLASLLDFNAY